MAKVITSNAAFSRVLRNWGRVMMHHSRRDFMRIMRESGLSMPQLSLFMRIHYHRSGCNVSDVAAQLGVSNARASQMIERLVVQGLLERSEDPDDRRAKRITLTEAGEAQVQRVEHSRQQWLEELTSTLSEAQRAQIRDALILLTEAASELEGLHPGEGK